MKRPLIAFPLFALVLIGHGTSVAQGTSISDLPLHGGSVSLDTIEGDGSPVPSKFSLATIAGVLSGRFYGDDSRLVATLSIGGEVATLTYGSSGSFSSLDVNYPGLGSIHSRSDGTIAGSISDCDTLTSSSLFNALQHSLVAGAPVSNHILALTDRTSTEDRLFSIYHLALRPALLAPTAVGCEIEFADPLWGVCTIYETYGACAGCCDRDADMDARISQMTNRVGYVVDKLAPGWISDSIFAFGELVGGPSNCLERVCAGKPGDPNPTTCESTYNGQAFVGYCMFGCPHQNGGPAPGQCEHGQACCPTPNGVECQQSSDQSCADPICQANPWDPCCESAWVCYEP